MTSSRVQDVSLYELALSSEQPPHPLQVSPSTFKSMVGLFLDILIELNIPATLWMKLPRGDIWQTEVDRFRKSANCAYAIYTLNTFRDEADEKDATNLPVEGNSADFEEKDEADISLISDQGIVAINQASYSTLLNLSLAPDSQLRREYFLMVLADNFCGIVLAHRPRTVRQSKSDPGVMSEPLSSLKVGTLGDEDTERKHPLLGLCSFEKHTIHRVLDGIQQAVKFGLTEPPLTPEVTTLLETWNSFPAQVTLSSLDPDVVGHLFTKQVQRQEEIWRNSAVFRKQADVSTVLQMENEELLNSIRLKNEFLKNVGQELRTPLATMKTALSLLSSPTLKPAQRQRYMEMVTQECDRQSSLITSVLDLVQLETVVEQTPMQPLRLMDVVPGVVSTYQPLAQEKGLMLAYTIPEDLPAVACLSASLRQIVINLLHNSIKFTPKGGQVWVRAKQQGEYIQVEFRDTGIGIAPSDIPKIFERFYRVRGTGADESTNGAGLGLSIVQQLLLRCGGSISVKSKVGEGSTFIVLLPIYH